MPIRPGSVHTVVATNLLRLDSRPSNALTALAALLTPSSRRICSWPRADAGPWRVAQAEWAQAVPFAMVLARSVGRTAIGVSAPRPMHHTSSADLIEAVTFLAGRLHTPVSLDRSAGSRPDTRRPFELPRGDTMKILMIVAAAVLLASGCSTSPASKQDVCDSFDALGVQMLQGNGIIGNPLFRAAESLADTADRYEGGGLSADAKRLHEISDSDATSVAELMNATTNIADLCGHPLGIGSNR